MQQLRARAAEVEHEREERLRDAAAEERARIARELHDVVAHSVSVMVVQAGAASRRLRRPGAAREALARSRRPAARRCSELRRLLGVCARRRGRRWRRSRACTSLDDLVAQVREAGLPVELTIDGHADALPQGVDLSAYRIVQEALTNTLKHAGRDRVRRRVRYATAVLEIEIV